MCFTFKTVRYLICIVFWPNVFSTNLHSGNYFQELLYCKENIHIIISADMKFDLSFDGPQSWYTQFMWYLLIQAAAEITAPVTYMYLVLILKVELIIAADILQLISVRATVLMSQLVLAPSPISWPIRGKYVPKLEYVWQSWNLLSNLTTYILY